MHAIRAVYDGIDFKPESPIPFDGKYEVEIKFVRPMEADEELREKRPLSELHGILRGKVWMADDFDAPLEEMKEYM
ncbi:MAG: DUF2281 domain-containing protein [Clostridiales bacterium]|jgi:hypothetical protein|nr:DUF2281 domain-containing protein [Clostridiales bacterium]